MIKQIDGYGGNYSISDSGVVIGFGREMKQENNHGYCRVCLYHEGVARHVRVHRLVAIAFIPNPLNLPQVNHKDEDKMNNAVGNLEWCTPQHNSEHSKAKTHNLTSPSGVLTEIHNLSKYCREHLLNPSHMLSVSKGLRQSHKGWTAALR